MKKLFSFHYLLLFTILSAYLLLTVGSSLRESLTFDEIVNVQEGLNNVLRHTFDIEPYNPPLIRELAVLPIVFSGTTEGIPIPPHTQMRFSRAVIIFLGLILLISVYATARVYFGKSVGLLSCFLLAFEPTFLAHSHYITPDIGFTLFLFLALCSFFRVLKTPTVLSYLLFGILSGCVFASKIPGIPFLLLSCGFIFLLFHKQFPWNWHIRHFPKACMALGFSFLVVWATYGFDRTPILVETTDRERVSNRILSWSKENKVSYIVSGIQFFQRTPLPLGEYLRIVKNTIVRGKENRTDFFWGEYRSATVWFWIPQFFLKTSVSLLFILFLSGIQLLRASNFRRQGVKNNTLMLFFLLPILSIFAVSSVFRFSPLVRYFLPALPFLFISISRALPWFMQTKIKKTVFLGLLTWYVLSTVAVFPHFITHTNEILPFVHKPYTVFTDSNISWGQELVSLKAYVQLKKPELVYLSYFGRDDASRYGFSSDNLWGSYKKDEICGFHAVSYPEFTQSVFYAISVTNWHECGYENIQEFFPEKVKDFVAGSVLIF